MPKSTKDIPTESTNLFLFVGPYDAGKSYAATSFGLKSKEYGGNDDRPCYMLELDGREQALRGRPIVYDTFNNIEGAIGVLNKVKELRETAVKFGKVGFHTLILDSFTTYNDFAISDSQEVTELKKSQGEKVGRTRGDLLMLTMEDYGYEAEAWRQLMYDCLFDLKRFCNVIVTAHEVESYRQIKTALGEPTKSEFDGYKILAHGNKIAARIPTKFDEIYHFHKKEVVVATRSIRRQVSFQDEVARTSIPNLAKEGVVKYDISGKEFYTWWLDKINNNNKGQNK